MGDLIRERSWAKFGSCNLDKYIMKGNACADILAKKGRPQSKSFSFLVFVTPPSGIQPKGGSTCIIMSHVTPYLWKCQRN